MSDQTLMLETEYPFIMPPKPKVKAYWWKGKLPPNTREAHPSTEIRPPNWGDWLTPLLLARFAHVDAVWTERGTAEVVCVGSILGQIIGPWYNGVVLGSGKLHQDETVPTNAKILALRGPLSAKNVPGTFALGDPGLLADELVQIETKMYDLCIIPHWSDTRLANDPKFTQFEHVVIDSTWNPLDIIRIVAESKKVVSSSLHGLILADALAIPRRFESSADWSKDGGHFKVRDHNAAVGLPFEIGKLQEADANRVVNCKTCLKEAFRAYSKLVMCGSYGETS